MNKKAFFKEVFSVHYRTLIMQAYSMLKDEQQAKDLIQDLFVDLWEKSDLTEIQSMKSYLSRAVHNRCLNFIKNSRKDSLRIKEYISHTDSVSLPDPYQAEQAETKSNRLYKLLKAMEDLPPKTAAAFNLYYLEKKSRKDVAAELNVSLNTVKTMLLRAVKTLRKKIN